MLAAVSSLMNELTRIVAEIMKHVGHDSSVGRATFRGLNPGGNEIFCNCPYRTWALPPCKKRSAPF
jgi:hypothetical protein